MGEPQRSTRASGGSQKSQEASGLSVICSFMFRVGCSGGLGDFRMPAVTFRLVILMAPCWLLLSIRTKQRSDLSVGWDRPAAGHVGLPVCWCRAWAVTRCFEQWVSRSFPHMFVSCSSRLWPVPELGGRDVQKTLGRAVPHQLPLGAGLRQLRRPGEGEGGSSSLCAQEKGFWCRFSATSLCGKENPVVFPAVELCTELPW